MPGVGQRVAGRYRIARPLGSGGLGRVWLAIDEMLHRDVAIKQCAPPDGLEPDEQELLRSWMPIEARAAGRVSHPNVIRIYDVLPGEDEPWIVMEYVPSRSLLQVIKESGPLPVERVAGIGLALLSALDAAHRAGVLHLDVKPGNVLIADDARVVLTDFGPAVTGEGIAALARRGMILGSPNYVSPERLFDGVAAAPADLWSLGATLYHAVEGRPPYVRETPAATMRALAGSAPDRHHLAGPLAGVLDGLLRRDPGARMTAVEAGDRLSRLAGAGPAPAARCGCGGETARTPRSAGRPSR
ncbi:serine/threonine-protein kinase [Actinoplanes sp. NPDC049118]|uniref:serine/threonine-protein kinase n=1 Tax=Actinoplanes sp. NPDC049118 TaxID=3155769 RepID=UPI0033FDFECF